MVKAYVVSGKGIGCQVEVVYAFEKAGAEVEIIHFNELLSGKKNLFDSQILDFPADSYMETSLEQAWLLQTSLKMQP